MYDAPAPGPDQTDDNGDGDAEAEATTEANTEAEAPTEAEVTAEENAEAEATAEAEAPTEAAAEAEAPTEAAAEAEVPTEAPTEAVPTTEHVPTTAPSTRVLPADDANAPTVAPLPADVPDAPAVGASISLPATGAGDPAPAAVVPPQAQPEQQTGRLLLSSPAVPPPAAPAEAFAATPPATAAPSHSVPVLVVCGVSGSGKSTIGALLAERLGWVYAEADAFHPPANVAKMAAGHPLDDADRVPWLAAIGAYIDETTLAGRPAVVTCSALKRTYRDELRQGRPNVQVIFLEASYELIRDRLQARAGHFFPAELLASQFRDLEPPEPDEHVLQISVADGVEQVVERLLSLGVGVGVGATVDVGAQAGVGVGTAVLAPASAQAPPI
jgi:gluconokinase